MAGSRQLGGAAPAPAPVTKPLNDQVVAYGQDGAVTLLPDRLDRDGLAQQIADVIRAVDPPFTVAIYGPWGEGKTHLLRSVQAKVDAAVDPLTGQPAFHTVWFDLWEHQADVNPVVALLQTARDHHAYPSEVLARIGDVIEPLLWTAADVASDFEVGFGQVTVKTGGSASHWKRHRKERLQARRRVQDDQVRLQGLFRAALDGLAGDRKLAFFIDDLDRCLPERVIDVLEKIKLFMAHPKCVFVLAADADAVVQAIREVKRYKDPAIAEHYLEKMVQVAFDLPPVAAATKDAYLKALLAEAANHMSLLPTLTETQIEQIAALWRPAFEDPKVDASTRLMIRTVNTFVVDHAIVMGQPGKGEYQPKVTGYDPRVMAVLAAIKTCYRAEFRELRARHDQRPDLLAYLLNAPKEDNPARTVWPEVFPERGGAFLRAVQAAGLEVSAELAEACFRLAGAAGAGAAPDTGPRSTLGLVEFERRAQSTAAEVAAVQRQILAGGEGWAGSPDAVVRLSGYNWRVLALADQDGHRQALLLADRVIGTGPYHRELARVTWETCDLRHWLNGEFLMALGEPVWTQIAQVRVDNLPNPVWDIPGGHPTTDRVFLLSLQEAVQHLAGNPQVEWPDYKDRVFQHDGLVARDENNQSAWWWLRSPGNDGGHAAFVRYGGSVGDIGSVIDAAGGVRPALTIRIPRS
jgi:hypothetical protein